MKSHTAESILPANPRFHLRQADGLFRPIPFVFVGEAMCQDIERERQTILETTRPERLAPQQKLLDRYDPRLSVHAFDDILRLFGVTKPL